MRSNIAYKVNYLLNILIYNYGLHEKLISIIILMRRSKDGFDIKQITTHYTVKSVNLTYAYDLYHMV